LLLFYAQILFFANLQWIGEHDLRSPSTPSRHYFGPNRDPTIFAQLVTHEIVHRQLDGFFWRHTHDLGRKSSVQTFYTFKMNDYSVRAIFSITFKLDHFFET